MAVSQNCTPGSLSQSIKNPSEQRINETPALRQEIHKMEDKLVESVFYNNITGLAVLDARACFIIVNPSFSKLLGHDKEDLIGRRLRLIFSFDQWRSVSKAAEEILSGEQAQIELSTTCIHKNGKKINALMHFSLISDLLGMDRCLVVAVHATNESKWVNKKPDDNRRYYQAISENSFDAMLIFEDGICIDANPVAEEMFGIPLEELIGMPGADLAVPENRSIAHERIASGDESPYHAVALKRDGTRFYVMVQVKVVRMGNRTVRMTMIRDIDRRVRAEKAFHDSERHLRSLMESAKDFVLFRLRRNPNDPDRPDVIFVSPSIRDFVDSSWEPDFQQWISLLHPDDSQSLIELTDKMLENQRLDKRVRMRNVKDGSWRWLRIVCGTVNDESGNLFFNGIVLDETSEVEAVEALKAREHELRQRTESLSEVNTALEVLLRKREADRADVEEKMLNNAKNLVLPYLDKLKNSKLDKRQRLYLSLIESNINEFVSPLTQRMSRHYLTFTPLEIQVANLVKEGKTTKDIAQILMLSVRTIESVRYTIRRKLGITEKRASLRNHLISISDGGNFSFRN